MELATSILKNSFNNKQNEDLKKNFMGVYLSNNFTIYI